MIDDDNKRKWYRPNYGERYTMMRVKGEMEEIMRYE